MSKLGGKYRDWIQTSTYHPYKLSTVSTISYDKAVIKAAACSQLIARVPMMNQINSITILVIVTEVTSIHRIYGRYTTFRYQRILLQGDPKASLIPNLSPLLHYLLIFHTGARARPDYQLSLGGISMRRRYGFVPRGTIYCSNCGI